MNDFCCEIVQVCINVEFRTFTTSRSPSPPKNGRTATKSDASIEMYRKTEYPPEKNCASASNVFLFTNQTAGSPANAKHLIFFVLNQVTQDQANCCIYSILGQLQNCPKDYSPVYFRRWMAHHFCTNIQSLWVNI